MSKNVSISGCLRVVLGARVLGLVTLVTLGLAACTTPGGGGVASGGGATDSGRTTALHENLVPGPTAPAPAAPSGPQRTAASDNPEALADMNLDVATLALDPEQRRGTMSPEEGLEHASRAIVLTQDPVKKARGYALASQIHAMQGRAEDARTAAIKAVKAAPGSGVASGMLRQLVQQTQQTGPDGAAALRADLTDSPRALHLLDGLAAERSGDAARATEAYAAYLEGDGQDAMAAGYVLGHLGLLADTEGFFHFSRAYLAQPVMSALAQPTMSALDQPGMSAPGQPGGTGDNPAAEAWKRTDTLFMQRSDSIQDADLVRLCAAEWDAGTTPVAYSVFYLAVLDRTGADGAVAEPVARTVLQVAPGDVRTQAILERARGR